MSNIASNGIGGLGGDPFAALKSEPPAPSPTPSPTPPVADHATGVKISAAANAGQGITPDTVAGIGVSANTPAEAAVNSQLASAVSLATRLKTELATQSADYQNRWWKAMPNAVKSLMLSTNYRPPSARAPGTPVAGVQGPTGNYDPSVYGTPTNQSQYDQGGYVNAVYKPNTGLHDIAHYIDDTGVNWVGHQAAETVKTVAGDAAKPFTIVGGVANHLERAAFENSQTIGEQAAASGDSWHNIFDVVNPVDILHHWGSTQNGQSSFQPYALSFVKKHYGFDGPTLQLVKLAAATGGDLNTVLKSIHGTSAADTTAQRQRAAELMNNPNGDFEKAVQLLSDSHLSFGQVMFGGLTGDQMHAMYPKISAGQFDAENTAGQVIGTAGVVGATALDPAEASSVGGLFSRSAFADVASIRGVAAGAEVAGATGAIGNALISNQTVDQANTIAPFGTAVHPLSGIADGFLSWYGNPLQMGLIGMGAYKSAVHSAAFMRSAGTAEDVMAHYASVPSSRDFAVKAAEALTTPFRNRDGAIIANEPNIELARRAGIPLESQGQIDQIKSWFPELKKAVDEGHGETVIAQMQASTDAGIQMMMGNAGKFFHNATVFPHITIPQGVRDKIMGFDAGSSGWAGRRFNVDALTPTKIAEELVGKSATDEGILAAKADAPLTPTMRFAQRLGSLKDSTVNRTTTLVPLQKFISFSGNPSEAAVALAKEGVLTKRTDLATNNLTLISRLLHFAIPKADHEAWLNGYAMLENKGMQRAFVYALIRNMADLSGVTRTPEGQAFIDRWWKQSYGASEGALIVNPFDREGPPIPAALNGGQFADAMALPDFREWYKYAKKSYLMEKFHSALTPEWMDRFMSSYWKPVLLMRSGFALRFAGEEVLNSILRNGLKPYAESRVAISGSGALNARKEARVAATLGRANSIDNLDEHGNALETLGPILKKAQTDGLIPNSVTSIKEINMLEAKRVFDSLKTAIPDEIFKDSWWQGREASMLNKRDRLSAHIAGFEAINWGRALKTAAFRKVAPDELLKYADELTKRGMYDSLYGDRVSAYLSHGTPYWGDELGKIRTDEGIPVEVRIGKGADYEVAPRGSDQEIGNWYFRLMQQNSDPLPIAMSHGYVADGERGALQAGIDYLSSKGLNDQIAEAKSAEAAHGEKMVKKWGVTDWQAKADSEFFAKHPQAQGDEAAHPDVKAFLHIKAHQKYLADRLKFREEYLANSPRYNAVGSTGERVDTGEVTRDVAIRDWAESQWGEMKHLMFSEHPQNFEMVKGENGEMEKVALPVEGESEPIKLTNTTPPRNLWRITSGGDKGRELKFANTTTAYTAVPEGHVRLFHGTPVTGSDLSKEFAPGRSWTPDYAEASRHAGEHGNTYQIDVPWRTAVEHYKFHGTGSDAALASHEDARIARHTEAAKTLKWQSDIATSAHNEAVAQLAKLKAMDGVSAKKLSEAMLEVRRTKDQMATTAARSQSIQRQLSLAKTNPDLVTRHVQGIMDDQRAGEGATGNAPHRAGYFESGDIASVKSEAGAPRTLIGEMAKNGEGARTPITPDTSELKLIDKQHIPENITAPPRMVTIPPGTWATIVTKGMRATVGIPADYLSRGPAFLHNYAMSRREVDPWLISQGIMDKTGDLAHEIAQQRAFDETITYLHDPRARSQFSEITRNLMPFWFAQEQFYKRWARLFGTYPEAFYKLQQTMNGLRSVGFVSKDAFGKDAFIYPGSPAMLHFVAKTFGADIPVGVGISGEINQLNPSLATGLAPWPSWGPVATLPMTVVGGMFPHTDPFIQSLLGPSAPPVNEKGGWKWNAIKGLLPSVVTRTFDWMYSSIPGQAENPNVPSMYMQSMVQSAQYLETNNLGLPSNANAHQRQQYADRISNWAQNLMLFRTMAGFFGPSTPTFKFNDHGIGAQFQALVNNMPYSDAVNEMVKLHPNATPYTIFSSTTSGLNQSGAYVPATQAASDWLNQNADFVNKYPQFAPWAMPTATASGAFSGTTYQKELDLGLRARRAFFDNIGSDGWYNSVKYAEGANVYFPLEAKVKAAELANPAAASEIKQKWHDWSSAFKQANPLFNQTLSDPHSHNRRVAVIGDLNKAISNADLPSNEFGTRLSELMTYYDQTVNFYNTHQGSSFVTARHEAKLQMQEWGDAFAAQHAAVAPIWNGLLRMETPG